MNIYSLYALHNSTVTASVEKQKRQMEELASATRSRFYQSVREAYRVDMERMRHNLDNGIELPNDFIKVMESASIDPLFNEIYFLDAKHDVCNADNPVKKFITSTYALAAVPTPPDLICDGFNMARTRMRVLAQDYKWNTRVIHDAHRSMTIVMFNPDDRVIVAYLLLTFNKDYLVHDYLAPEIIARFGSMDESGVSVWLDYWTKREVLVSNGPESFRRERPDYIQRFPDMLQDWHLRITFQETPEIAASKASLIRNLFFLGTGVFLLIGTLLFMYITAQKERELGMRQAAFLANVTHELKTPLAVMQAAGENLADGRVTTKERLISYGEHIHTESLRLRKMIEKLLDVAKNEAGQLTLKPVASSLTELTRDYLFEHESYIKSRNFNVDLKVDENIPEVMVDQNSFYTIIGNLVENAVKYSPTSDYIGIHIFSDNKNVYLQVIDKGTGIPKEAQQLIFEKFYRVEDSLTANTKGHGLGLSIVKNLTESNGGKISVESEHGKGSIFTLTFPAIVKENATVIVNGTTNKQKEHEYVV